MSMKPKGVPLEGEEVYYWHGYSLVIVGLALLLLILIGINILLTELSVIHFPFIMVLVLIVGFFYSMTIIVEEGRVIVKYGVGLFVTEIDFHSIGNYRFDKNNYFRAWLYNPMGDKTLVLELRGGTSLVLPIDDPKHFQEVTRIKY